MWAGEDYALVEIFEPKDVPERFDRPKHYRGHRASGLVPAWAAHQLTLVIPVGERNSTVYRLAKDLFKAGFSELEIVRRILESPTYDTQDLSGALAEEITLAVASGIKKAREETNDG